MENNVLIQDQSYSVSFLWRPVVIFPEGLYSYQKSLDDRLSIGNCKIPDKTDLSDLDRNWTSLPKQKQKARGIDFKFDQQTEVDNKVYVNMFINAYI